jgi:F-type H+-transporting ATPase subunit delta
MADFTTVARPYASAVYKLAHETSSLEAWGDALALLAAVVSDVAMIKALDNPELGKDKKGEMLIHVLNDKLNQQQQNLVKLMAENGRLNALPDVAEQFEVYRAQAEGKVEAEVTSAFKLSAEQEKNIIAMLKKKLGREVTLTTSIDESLIGGVLIKAGDTIIDGSMKSSLESLALTLSR